MVKQDLTVMDMVLMISILMVRKMKERRKFILNFLTTLHHTYFMKEIKGDTLYEIDSNKRSTTGYWSIFSSY